MKKSLIALAVLAASGATFAQSSVTLFGTMDVSATYMKSMGQGVSSLESDGLSDSLLGLRGIEDLGNGLKIGFWLEGSIGADDGGSNFSFDRRSTVSLLSDWGEIRLGRDRYVFYDSYDDFNNFSTLGTILQGALFSDSRAGNTVTYHLPEGVLGGLYGAIQYKFGETDGSKNSAYGIRLGYEYGPLNINAGYGKMKDEEITEGFFTGVDYATPLLGDVTTYNIAASYDFEVAAPFIAYGEEQLKASPDKAKYRYATLGVNIPLGEGELRLAGHYAKDKSKTDAFTVFGKDEDIKRLGIGYTYNLSKRTALYTNFEYTKYSYLSDKDKGIQFGINHSF